MRIACPACAAAYEVPDRLLAGTARTLRCSRCEAEFTLPRTATAEPPPPAADTQPAAPPEPPPPAPEPVVVSPLAERAFRPEPRPVPQPAAHAAPEPASPALVRAWVASIALVLAVIVSLLVFHAEVMAAWPASRRLFAALGLA